MNNLVKLALLLGASSLLGACGVLSKSMTDNDTYLDKAETATGIAKADLKLDEKSIHTDMNSVRFVIYDRLGTMYKCYFTTMVAVDSDALCSKISADSQAAEKAKPSDDVSKPPKIMKGKADAAKDKKPSSNAKTELKA